MNFPRIYATAALALVALAHTSCAAQYGTRETFAAGGGDADTQLRAAESELAGGDADDAREALQALASTPLSERQQLVYRLLTAEVALAQQEPLAALQALPSASATREPELGARIERVRALALFGIGDAVAGTHVMVQRERLLADPAARTANREQLWTLLQASDLDTATGSRLAQSDRITRGWVQLAVLARSVWTDAADLQRGLAEWRAAFPQHPAESHLGSIRMAEAPGRRELRSLALLLPLSGSFAATGEAVRDGFFAAWYEAPAPRPAVRVYDTGTTPDTLKRAWNEALDEGAEFVVGPLRREDVAAIADEGKPAVPTLALNYLDPGKSAPFNFYQWGLAPEDEARQAAERAVADRQYRALTLVPEGDWGARVMQAFSARLQELGGVVVHSQTYPATARDHSESIRKLMSLDASEERHRALTAALGVQSEFEPRRRQDIDMIFIAARPDQAKLIGPQLRFHRSGSLPIYATALIYDGGTPDPDLSGLRFCDMPWMLADSGPWATLRGQLKALFPSRAPEYSRLLALGHDAYTLSALIDSGQMRPGSFFPAASGTLALRDGGSITRSLSCAEVRGSALKPLDISMPRAEARP